MAKFASLIQNNHMPSHLEQQEINEVLESFKLRPNEREVYLALLQMGPSTVTPLARSVRLPVTTTQSILKRLFDMSIIKISSSKTRQIYEAEDPIIFKKLLERQIEDFGNVIPLLKQMQTDKDSETKIEIYTHQRMADIFYKALSCKEKVMYEIMSPKDFQEILGEKFHLTKRRVDRGIYLKTLRVENFEIKKYTKESHKEKLREVKFLPREFTFQSSIVFWDDSIALFSSRTESLACVITSKSIREMFGQLFDMLWSVSRPV